MHSFIGRTLFVYACAIGFAATTIAAEATAKPKAANQFVVAKEPAGATSIAAAKAVAIKEAAEVVLVGQILTAHLDPFEKDKAAFVLTELPNDAHAKTKGHKSDDCPFCKRRAAKAPKVIVQCLGADGQMIPIDSRKLLGLAPNQTVVVKGTGKVNADLDIFMLEAKNIYIRR